ncbi:hypothetical protein SAMN05880592_11653 [Bosea sp. TND4EK4]|nr:hypothetical protein SAMN05880592_11653 [Bosea sp. TND4EK4]
MAPLLYLIGVGCFGVRAPMTMVAWMAVSMMRGQVHQVACEQKKKRKVSQRMDTML